MFLNQQKFQLYIVRCLPTCEIWTPFRICSDSQRSSSLSSSSSTSLSWLVYLIFLFSDIISSSLPWKSLILSSSLIYFLKYSRSDILTILIGQKVVPVFLTFYAYFFFKVHAHFIAFMCLTHFFITGIIFIILSES